MMRTAQWSGESDGLAVLDPADTQLLTPQEERQLLRSLAECKGKLAAALANLPGVEAPGGADTPQDLARYITEAYSGNGPVEAGLGAIYRRYAELRGKIALANMRLVAHVAKRFRDRGIAYPDLLQEGFCGLLEAIDRFDLTHETKLATYATWWIRQAMQRAVAAGAYPVRLSPRHLRQLAQNQDELDAAESGGTGRPTAASSEMIRRIHTATRPTLSLNATLSPESDFNLLQAMSDPEPDATDAVETDEAIGKLMEVLGPRERQVLELRFGLAGADRLSLSQVGKVLAVSKERVRQIQDRALQKIRSAAEAGPGLPDLTP